MKFLGLLCIVTCVFAAAEKCVPRCGPIAFNSDSDFIQNLSLYSEPDYKGEHLAINITGPYGCTNVVPNFRIKSLLSAHTTQIVLHYGEDCIGHVIKQFQNGWHNVKDTADCPGSIFLKHQRYEGRTC